MKCLKTFTIITLFHIRRIRMSYMKQFPGCADYLCITLLIFLQCYMILLYDCTISVFFYILYYRDNQNVMIVLQTLRTQTLRPLWEDHLGWRDWEVRQAWPVPLSSTTTWSPPSVRGPFRLTGLGSKPSVASTAFFNNNLVSTFCERTIQVDGIGK